MGTAGDRTVEINDPAARPSRNVSSPPINVVQNFGVESASLGRAPRTKSFDVVESELERIRCNIQKQPTTYMMSRYDFNFCSQYYSCSQDQYSIAGPGVVGDAMKRYRDSITSPVATSHSAAPVPGVDDGAAALSRKNLDQYTTFMLSNTPIDVPPKVNQAGPPSSMLYPIPPKSVYSSDSCSGSSRWSGGSSALSSGQFHSTFSSPRSSLRSNDQIDSLIELPWWLNKSKERPSSLPSFKIASRLPFGAQLHPQPLHRETGDRASVSELEHPVRAKADPSPLQREPTRVSRSFAQLSLDEHIISRHSTSDLRTEPTLQTITELPVHLPLKYEKSMDWDDYWTDNSSSDNESCHSHGGDTGSTLSTGELTDGEKWKSRRRKLVVDRIVAGLQSWLSARLSQLAYQLEAEKPPVRSHAEGQPQQKTTRSVQKQSETGVSGRAKGKRPAAQNSSDQHFNEGDDSEDEDAPEHPRKRSRAATGVVAVPELYACPYFKHDPDKYRSRRGCPGPGWRSTHRVKEHLYRRHGLPDFQCPRCCVVFGDEDELTAHLRVTLPCMMQEERPFDGFNKKQEKQLRSRKKPEGATGEVDLWTHVYRILFPDDVIIPSPFYDLPMFPSRDPIQDKATVIEQLRAFSQHRFAVLMREELYSEVDSLIEQHIGTSDRVMSIAQSVFESIIRAFQTSHASQTVLPAVTQDQGAPGPSTAVESPLDFDSLLLTSEVPILSDEYESFGLSFLNDLSDSTVKGWGPDSGYGSYNADGVTEERPQEYEE